MTLNNSTIKVPRSIFGKEADGLKVKTLDGKTTTLGELQGPIKTVKKNPFGNTEMTWSFKPNLSKNNGKSAK